MAAARLVEDARKAQRKLGRDGFKKLKARLADMESASSLGDLPAGRPHPLQGNWKGKFALDLYRTRFPGRFVNVFKLPAPSQEIGA